MVTQRHVVAVDEARGWPAGVTITSTRISPAGAGSVGSLRPPPI